MTTKEVALSFFSAADKGDFTTVEKLFGTRHQFYSPMGPDPLDTAQHIGMMQAFHAGFSDTSHEIQDTLESGSKVAVRGVWHGKHTGTFNGIPASGNDVHLPFIAIVEVENNEMVNQWIAMDTMAMMMQIGAIPAPEAAAMN